NFLFYFYYVIFFFFFQAEDGIRDKLVTGVQTCALPIYTTSPAALFRMSVTLSTNVVLSVASVPMKATLCTPVVATGKVTLKLPKLVLAGDTKPPICAPSIEIISGCRYGATQHDRHAAWNDSV